MLRYQKWVLSLGVAAATTGVALGGPFDFLSPGSAQSRSDAELHNQRVAERVAQKLRSQNLRGFDIEIVVQDGVCRLGGKIANAEQKALASQVASQVSGVSSVQNLLTVLEQAPPSSTARPSTARPASNTGPAPGAIQQAAYNSPAAPAFQNTPSARQQPVQQTGFFGRMKNLGQRSQPAARSEQQIAVEIGQAISQMGLRGHKLDLKFQEGVATLTGTVQNEQQIPMITQVVSQNPYVRQVNNQIVAPGSRTPIQPVQFSGAANGQAAEGSNQAMAEHIARTIGQYQINGMDVEVRFNNGLATLNGKVAHPQLKMFAQQIAMSVPGVQNVNNQISFGPPPGGMQQGGMPQGAMPQGAMQRGAMQQVAYQQGGPGGPGPGGFGPGGPGPGGPGGMMVPPGAGARAHGGGTPSHLAYDLPNLPEYSWPTYASYPNYASLSYPKEYSASAWPYVGPFYPYPQVPLGWRQVQMEWDDGSWNLNFNPRTEKWFWYLDPKNW